MPAVFTIPPHRAFADALAAGLIAMYGGDKLALARGTILIPNNRAARAITDAFVRRAEGGLLLPRLVAVGDPELDERLGGLLDPIAGTGDEPVIPPAIDMLERQMILARLVAQTRTDAGDPIDTGEAMRLAGDLAATLDQLLVDRISPTRLREIAAAPELSEHWQRSLIILDTILTRWPKELARLGRIDAADRRNRLLDRVAQSWRTQPPQGFVVAAGIATTAPAVAQLLAVVARLPEGMVVLPGVDLTADDAEWDALGPHEPQDGRLPRRPIETHPQYQLKRLLDLMSVGRGEVRPWRWGGGRDARSVRTAALSHAMAPAEFTDKWHRLKPAERRLTGVRAIELATPAEEAQTIALALREAIETPGRTAALVTPDRALARRVTAHLARWNIVADDSAGTPLSLTPAGTLLLAIAEAAADRFAPVPLLALLKHPLVRSGETRGAWLDGARLLDRALRGPRPPGGLDGISRYLADGDRHAIRVRAPAQSWWAEVRALLEPIEAGFSRPFFAPLLAALREAAVSLAGDAAWARPDGRAAADLIARLEEAVSLGPADCDPAALSPMLRRLMDAVAIRPPQGGHPRLSIWGLLEARLQHADLMVLGGLNEGVWPATPSPDPWLAPRIRAELGLPGLERRIGLSAHDLAMALGAREVIVTRARRDDRAPTIASRFWLRLEAMTGGLTPEPRLKNWAGALDRPAGPPQPAGRPAPSPPVGDRPRIIAVTKLDRLKADPFAFYADAMLHLYPMDAVDADPTPAWRGSAVHAVFEAWMKEDRCDPDLLLPRAQKMLDDMAAHAVMKALWEPRLIDALSWVAQAMHALKQEGRIPVAAEIDGRIDIAGVTLKGKVDRIDRQADGSLAIVDYKTGAPPSAAQVEAGYSMQLGLLGLIAERRGFKEVDGLPLSFEYWSLGRSKDGTLGYAASPVGKKDGTAAEDFTALSARVLTEAVEKWLTGSEPFTAKLVADYAPYADYDQLMRLDEWYGRADG